MLLRSIRGFLRPEETARHAAQVWQRHRLMVPFSLGAFVLLASIAALSGFEGIMLPIAFGAAGAAIAGTATTSYTIVVLTDRNLVLLRGSRVRVVAVAPFDRLPSDTAIERSGGTMLISDWRIGDRVYSATKANEQELTAMQQCWQDDR